VKPGGRALLIGPDNKSDNDSDKWVPIEQAVASGRCYGVDVAADILAWIAMTPTARVASGHCRGASPDDLRPIL
jgi:hypothetical protein